MTNHSHAIEFPPHGIVLEGAKPEWTSQVGRALFITQAQDKFLQKGREALDRMLELTILCQGAADPQQATWLEEFETLISFLEKLADTEIDGIRLFRTANLIVDLPDQSDTLILPGIDLNHPAFRCALNAKIGNRCDHSPIIAALQNANRWIAIGRSMIAANLERLFFLDQRLDVVKARVLLLPTATPNPAQELHPEAPSGQSARSSDPVPSSETQSV